MNPPPPTGLRAPTTAEQEALQRIFWGLRDSRDSVANARNDILGIACGGKGRKLNTEQLVDISIAFSVYASTAEAERTEISRLLRVVYVANDLLFCAKSPAGLQDQMKKHLVSLMYAASKVPTADNNSQEKFERIIKLWKDKGVYGDVDNLLAALRGELIKAEDNVPAPDTNLDSVADPAAVLHEPGGATVSNPLTPQQNVPNFIPPTASAIPQHQMAPSLQLQPPELEKPPEQPAPVQPPPPDFQQQQIYQKLPFFVPPGRHLPMPPPSLPPLTLLPHAPGVSPIPNFPSQQPGQPIPIQPMNLPVGMQQPWVPPPMQLGIIPPPGGLQLPPPAMAPGVGLPALPLPPPSQGFLPPSMPQPPMPPPTYPPPVQNAVLGVQFPPSIPVMPPRAMLNPSPAKMPPPPATLDKMSGGQLVHIITGAIEGGGYTLYSPLHQQAEPQAPLMSPRKADKILDRVDAFCSRLARDKEDRDSRGRSERRRSSRSRSRSPRNSSSRRRSRSRSRSWSPRRSSRSRRR